MKHKVKAHHWENGHLKTMEHWFETLELAIAFADTMRASTIKIHNEEGEIVVHHTDAPTPESYA